MSGVRKAAVEDWSYSAFLVYNEVGQEVDVYLYLGIPNVSEQYGAHVGLITIRDGKYVLPDGQQFDDQEQAIWALWELKKGKSE